MAEESCQSCSVVTSPERCGRPGSRAEQRLTARLAQRHPSAPPDAGARASTERTDSRRMRLSPELSSSEVGEWSLRCERIDIAILDITLSALIAYARKITAARRRMVRRGYAAVEKSALALVLRPSAATTQGEAAKTGLPAGWMPQGKLFGWNVLSAHVDVMLLRQSLILGFEGLGCFRSASRPETEWDVSDAPQRATKRTGIEPVDDPLAKKKTL
jgi:hypothetical protein